MSMLTFNELVKEEDRGLIRFLIEDDLYTYIKPTCGNMRLRIDILILLAKRIKEIYLDTKRYRGICIAKMNVVEELNVNLNLTLCSNISEDILKIASRRNAIVYVGTCAEWETSRESDHLYWWKPYYGDDLCKGRCSKPRILFLDWVIAVLTAYKNEYCNK